MSLFLPCARRAPSVAALVATLLAAAAPAAAQNGMSDDRVSLPDGPGSIGGVGENVAINPNMGSASFSVPIDLPQGATAASTPSLALAYDSGRGMGNVGIGWEIA
ncbi:MAG: hypothetical protein KC635_24190, partial [Myxococcales bacterium]|nr:hypothetical protein [Myxococcales bacterium]